MNSQNEYASVSFVLHIRIDMNVESMYICNRAWIIVNTHQKGQFCCWKFQTDVQWN